MPTNDDDAINVDAIDDPYFRDAVLRHVQAYRDHFRARLCAVYVWGSVTRGEAVRPFSDLDLHAFTLDDLDKERDAAWFEEARAAMDHAFPGLGGLSRPLPIRLLQDGATPDASEQARAMARAFGCRLRYDGPAHPTRRAVSVCRVVSRRAVYRLSRFHFWYSS